MTRRISAAAVAAPVLVAETRAAAAHLCKLCDILDFEEPRFRELAGEILHGRSGDIILHRKLWEFTKTIQALEQGGLLHNQAVGISTAAGVERLLFYLANRVGRIVATDIYGVGSFAEKEADKNFLLDQRPFAPYPYRFEHLKALYMNALDLHFESNFFDFAFCLSSIEHFGGLKNSVQALREMGRVVRPGGRVIITTECALNGWRAHQVFTPKDIAHLVEEGGLRLVEEMDWRLSSCSLEHMVDMYRNDLSALPHINLKSLCSIFTSICLVFEKDREEDGELPRPSLEEVDETVAALMATTSKRIVESPHSSALEWGKNKLRSLFYRMVDIWRLAP